MRRPICRRGILVTFIPFTTRCLMSSNVLPLAHSESVCDSPRSDAACLWAFGDLPDVLEDLPGNWFDAVKVSDRRSEPRCGCSSRAALIPIDDPAADVDPVAIPIVLTDISSHGIGFSHTVALPHRLIRIAFDTEGASTPSLIVRLQWCRFRKPGDYESGGKIIRVATPASCVADASGCPD